MVTTLKRSLTNLNSQKLSGLYDSLCKISLERHPTIMYVGVWTFFESLSSLLGKNAGVDFPGFLRPKIKSWFPDRKNKSTFEHTLDQLNRWGNTTKHHEERYPVDAKQLAVDMRTLEPVILKILAKAIEEKNKV